MKFDRALLTAAVRATFSRRGTDLPTEAPLALTADFAEDPAKIMQWNAFIRKGALEAPAFPVIISRLSEFLMPLLEPDSQPTVSDWEPAEGWVAL